MRVVLVHYAFAPVPGGVETVMAEQARWMATRGWDVTVLAGSGAAMPGVRLETVPEMSATHPDVAAAQESLGDPGATGGSGGFVGADDLRERLLQRLRPMVEGADHVIVHNVMTMPFHLPLTAALSDLANERGRTIWWNWIHDVARCQSDHAWCHGDHAWHRLLARPTPGFRSVAVSHYRARQYARSVGCAPETIRVIPNGVALPPAGAADESFVAWLASLGKGRMGPLLFHPARLLPRKRVEFSLAVRDKLAETHPGATLLVSGAADPHRPRMKAYAEEIKDRAAAAVRKGRVVFLGERHSIGHVEMAAVYEACDMVLFPSREEGFGLPVLEAAWHGKAVFAPAKEPFTEFPPALSSCFYPQEAAPEDVAVAIRAWLSGDTVTRMCATVPAKVAVERNYLWDSVLSRHLLPLLDGASGVVL